MSISHSEQDRGTKQVDEYLTFFIAEVEYAVSLDHVREVIPYDTVTRVPGMPETVRGVTNLRGSVVPVIDLAIKFRLSGIEITPRTCIVLVETTLGDATMLLGLLTEEVGQVLAVDRNQLLPPPPFGTPVHTDYLHGMLPLGKKFALVLNIDHTLSQDELLTPPDPAADAATTSIDVAAGSSEESLDDADWGAAETASEPNVTGERAAARS